MCKITKKKSIYTFHPKTKKPPQPWHFQIIKRYQANNFLNKVTYEV